MIENGIQIGCPMRLLPILIALLSTCIFGGLNPVLAGGGPENVVVVVNGDSNFSLTVANCYSAWRQIPSSNIIVLKDVAQGGVIDADEFRDSILNPVLTEIVRRKLQKQIDYIVYSADFPTAINIRPDLSKLDIKLDKIYSPTASINGLTYLFMLALEGDPRMVHMESNRYYALNFEETLRQGIPSKSRDAFSRASKSFEEKSFAAASEDFRELAKTYPHLASLQIWLALCHGALGELEKTQAAIDQAAALGWQDRNSLRVAPALASLIERLDLSKLPVQSDDTPANLRISRAFKADHKWSDNHLMIPEALPGFHYFISAMLCVTENEFMSPEEALASLKRAIDSDYSNPTGTFYFTLTKNVRTTTREPGFAEAITELQRLGYQSEIVSRILPKNRDDILGLTMGQASFDWEASGNSIVPGGYCDNLTSFGGVIHSKRSNQTRLTALIKNGAAASSGTVTEPYAIQNKFTTPFFHVHYTRGYSLGEAFYQSVFAPYQLLLVGDPLCQPFAKAPRIIVKPSQPLQDSWRGNVRLNIESDAPVSKFEFYVDGRLASVETNTATIEFDSRKLPDGYHELRLVAEGLKPTSSKSSYLLPISVNNQGQNCSFEMDKLDPTKVPETVTGRAKSPGASEIIIHHAGRAVATIAGESGAFEVKTAELGVGPIRLIAIANRNGKAIRSTPLVIELPTNEQE